MTKNFLPAVLAFLGLFTPALLHSNEALATGILPAVLHDAEGNEVDSATLLKGKHIGLYFSAHWCPPCRAFTPALVKFRNDNVGNNFEVVFVSMDKSKGEKKKYIKEMEMKWLTVPGAGTREADSLARRFGTGGRLPMLIILAPDGSLVTPNGREDVLLSPETALNKWKEKNPS